MQFNNTTDKNGIIQSCEDLTGIGDGGISGNSTLLKKFTQKINRAQDRIFTTMLQHDESWKVDDTSNSTVPVVSINLVADQRSYSLSSLTRLMKINRVDISYNNTDFYKATLIKNRAEGRGLGNDASVDARYSRQDPYYELSGNLMSIYPRASSGDTGVIRITFTRKFTNFASTDTTKEPGFEEIWHYAIPVYASFEYAVENDLSTKIQTLQVLQNDYDTRLIKFMHDKNDDEIYTLTFGNTLEDYR
jgi:hypothetical protein